MSEAQFAITPLTSDDQVQAVAGTAEIHFDMEVAGQPLGLRAIVADKPVTLSAIVPLARMICDRIVSLTTQQAATAGHCVTCRKGCMNCCRYLVPLSVPETLCLQEDLNAQKSEVRQVTFRAFAAVGKKMISAGPPHIPSHRATDSLGCTVSPAGAAGQWYAQLDVTCPLLDQTRQACRMYDQRPLACREHMVISAPDMCRGFTPNSGDIQAPPVSVSEALGLLTADLEQTEMEAVMLPLATAWYQINTNRARRTWSATMMVQHFAQILRNATAKKSNRTAA